MGDTPLSRGFLSCPLWVKKGNGGYQTARQKDQASFICRARGGSAVHYSEFKRGLDGTFTLLDRPNMNVSNIFNASASGPTSPLGSYHR